ncbi:hypothetical protein Pcinc_008423 [Petrolisthes cinctipes]|uniref:Uncharacterized protein n=1 Tax=Petrolisthes cinctipes TaxID=88211 RepID=A0AAE1G8X0_PETCI|nr:hypothetical protein Pcinc_008423 [Petrolisthes cinctipes]
MEVFDEQRPKFIATLVNLSRPSTSPMHIPDLTNPPNHTCTPTDLFLGLRTAAGPSRPSNKPRGTRQ